MKIRFYQTESQKYPVLDFIKKLEVKDRARILACLKNIEELGLECPRVNFRQIKGALWEIKIRTASSGYRIFYTLIKSDEMILLHAYKKQTQKAPKHV